MTSMSDNVSERELHLLADAAFSPLVEYGFRRNKRSDSALSLTSNCVEVRVTSGDRIGNVETELILTGTDLLTSVFRLAPYLKKRDHPAYKNCQFNNADSARRALESHVDFLIQHCNAWLTGSLVAFQQIREFEDIDNGLYTQQFTRDARPDDRWDLVKSAWDRQQWAVFVELVGGLPLPLTEYEHQAIAYAEKRRTNEGLEVALPLE